MATYTAGRLLGPKKLRANFRDISIALGLWVLPTNIEYQQITTLLGCRSLTHHIQMLFLQNYSL